MIPQYHVICRGFCYSKLIKRDYNQKFLINSRFVGREACISWGGGESVNEKIDDLTSEEFWVLGSATL